MPLPSQLAPYTSLLSDVTTDETVLLTDSVNGETPTIINTCATTGRTEGSEGSDPLGTALLLNTALNWGQGLGWGWAPHRCAANHHCCCCEAPQTADVSHNQCCGCDTSSSTAVSHDTGLAINHCPSGPHHHDLHLYADTCTYSMDDVDYSMDCSGDFGF